MDMYNSIIVIVMEIFFGGGGGGGKLEVLGGNPTPAQVKQLEISLYHAFLGVLMDMIRTLLYSPPPPPPQS